MTTYLLIYHGGEPDNMNEAKAAWGKWFNDVARSIVDPGKPARPVNTVAKGKITKGVGKNPVYGYSILKAAKASEVTKMAKSCPVVKYGGKIEIYETFMP